MSQNGTEGQIKGQIDQQIDGQVNQPTDEKRAWQNPLHLAPMVTFCGQSSSHSLVGPTSRAGTCYQMWGLILIW
jgi:hypothetical protein